MTIRRPRNWVFLGDSITEGIGSSRVTYVTALAQLLRARETDTVHDVRLREVDPETFNPYIKVNLGGHADLDRRAGLPALWLWNLGAEGRTVDTDVRWFPLIDNLRPEQIFIHRGSLESIVRPAALSDGEWPMWVPNSWRGLVSMDPRCYYSDTPIRKLKQAAIDRAKQLVRVALLRTRVGAPLLDADVILLHYRTLLSTLWRDGCAITILGLLPPDPRTFPGSAEQFALVNTKLHGLAGEVGCRFLDWGAAFGGVANQLYYQDGFHPNGAGARRLAELLHAHLVEVGSV